MLKTTFTEIKCPLCFESFTGNRIGHYLKIHLSKNHNLIPNSPEYVNFLRDVLYPFLGIQTGYCAECGNPTKFIGKLSHGFEEFCCKKCRDKGRTERRETTCIKKYGVRHISQTEMYKEKYEKTSWERYGCKHPYQSQEVKEKAKQVFMKKHGVSCPLNVKEYFDKKTKTCIKKYGKENFAQTEDYKQKTKQTCLERYGYEHHLSSPQIQEKRKETWEKKYGVDHPNKNPDIVEKIKQSCIEKYGVSCPAFQLPEYLEKRERTWIENYGVNHPLKLPERAKLVSTSRRRNFFETFCEKLKKYYIIPNFNVERYIENSGLFSYHCNVCDKDFTTDHSIAFYVNCPHCKQSGASTSERDLRYFLQSLGISNIQYNTKAVITPLELDIYLPDYNLAIELNGMYWHCDIHRNWKYHINKTQRCKEKGIRLIHITDYEWDEKQEICQSIIKSALGMNNKIFARDCKIGVVSVENYKKFCENNHIQGYTKAETILGLYHNNELVQLCSFGKSRFKQNEFELIRHCSLRNTNIVGGFSKLISNYVIYNKPTNLISYCDLRWFTGKGYNTNHWELISQTQPNYWYFSLSEYYPHNRIEFQKHKLANKLTKFDPNLTEYQNMINNGWFRYYDCGSYKFQYKI